MKCTINIDKINSAIKEKIISQVPSDLFSVNKDKITSVLDVGEILFEPNMSIINEALKFAMDVKESHRDYFQREPVMFLKQLAQSASIDNKEALEIGGSYILSLAQKLFPYEGNVSPQINFINKINKEFKSDVLVRIGPKEWKIDIPEHTTMMYVAMDPDGLDTVMAYARREYIKKAGISINLIEEDNWVNFKELSDPKLQTLLRFMRKINPKARVSMFSDLDVSAVSLISDYIIMLRANSCFQEIPHEVAHFFLELLPDSHPLKKEMLKSIIDLPKYGEVYGKYKDNIFFQKKGKPDIDKIKREAAAQLIGDYVNAAFTGKADEKYGKKRSFIKRLVNGILKAIRKLLFIKVPVYYEHTQNPFKEAADQIINQDISQLEIKKVPTPYDSIFFSLVEELKEEHHELGPVVRQLQIFTSAMKSKLDRLFRDDINNSNWDAFRQFLQDGNINKASGIIYRMSAADKLLKEMLNESTFDYIRIIDALENMNASYRTFEVLPPAIDAAISAMEKEEKLDNLLNNIKELAEYSNISNNFERLTREFNIMLNDLRVKIPDETKEETLQKEKLIKLVEFQIQKGTLTFSNINSKIEKKFIEFYLKFVEKQAGAWIDPILEKYIKDYNSAKYNKTRNSIIKDVFSDPLLNPQIIFKMLMGNLNRYISVDNKSELDKDRLSDSIVMRGGIEVNMSEVLDTSVFDVGLFFSTSPATLKDVLVTSTVKFIFESISTGKVRGYVETLDFFKQILPLKNKIKEIEHYDLNKMLFTVEPIFLKNKDEQQLVRVLLSETKRFQYFYDKALIKDEITNLSAKLSDIRDAILDKPDDEKLKDIKKEVEEKIKEKRKELNKLTEEWGYRPFTQKYYDTVAKYEEGKDSDLLKEVKKIRKEMARLREKHANVFMINLEGSVHVDFSDLDSFVKDSMQLSLLDRRLTNLQESLPDFDKKQMEEFDELYSVDEELTNRIRVNHREKIITDTFEKIKNSGLYVNKSDSKIREGLEKAYDSIYLVNRPTDEFWKDRQDIWEQISNLLSSSGEFLPYKILLDDIKEREKKLKRNLYTISGEVDLFSVMFVELESGTTLISELNRLESDFKWFSENARSIQTLLNIVDDKDGVRFSEFSFLAGLQYVIYNLQDLEKYEKYLQDKKNIDFAEKNIKIIKDKIKNILSSVGDISDIELNKLIEISHSSTDISDFSLKLNSIDFSPRTDAQKIAIAQARDEIYRRSQVGNLIYSSLQDGIQKALENILYGIKSLTASDYGDAGEELSNLFDKLNDMGGKTVSHNYTMMMSSFLSYADLYLKNDSYYSSKKEEYRERYEDFMKIVSLRSSVLDWEALLGEEDSGLFHEVLDYMNKEWNEGVLSDAMEEKTSRKNSLAEIKNNYRTSLFEKIKEYIEDANNVNKRTSLLTDIEEYAKTPDIKKEYLSVFTRFLDISNEYDKEHLNNIEKILKDNILRKTKEKEIIEKINKEVNKEIDRFIEEYEQNFNDDYRKAEIRAANIEKLVNFYRDMHTTRHVKNMMTDEYTVVTPLKFVTKFEPKDEKYYSVDYPKFLTQRTVKKEYRTEKIHDTDPRVIRGELSPTVDINGNWLPLPKKGKYWSDEYHELKNNPSKKLVFEFLQKLKLYYLTRQDELLEQDRLDLRVPAKRIDEYEEIMLLKNPKAFKDYMLAKVPFISSSKEAEAQAVELNLSTQTVYDEFTKSQLSRSQDDNVKLYSLRIMPIDTTTEDVLASITNFITDLNIYKSKNFAKPIIKAIRDMYINTHERYGTNKNRAYLHRLLYDSILDKVPDSLFNVPQVANFVDFILKLSGLKLAGDIIGSTTNLLSGQGQLLIESMVGVGAMENFRKATVQSGRLFMDYQNDYFRVGEQGLNSQIVTTFNMLPDGRNLSDLLSWKNMTFDFRENLMKIRSVPEDGLGIQTAMTIIMTKTNIVDKNGLTVQFYDLYTLKDGIISLKDEYSHLEGEWNPINGTEVIRMRSAIVQFYTLLHGNYYQFMESWLSKYSIGRAFEMMKKYMIPMLLNRYQERVMDIFSEKERIGSHRASVNYVYNMIKGFLGKDEDKEYSKYLGSRPTYKMALRKTLNEIGFLILMGLLIPLVFGYDDDDDERNKKLSEMSWAKQVALIIALRVQGELGTFIPLPVAGLGYMEMKRALFDPFGVPKSTVDNLSAILRYTLQHIGAEIGLSNKENLFYKNKKKYDYWLGGIGAIKDKGDSKLMATLWNTIGLTFYTFEPAPYIMTFTQMQNKVR